MNRILVPLTLAALVLLPVRPAPGQAKKETAEAYFPLKVGTTWTYKVNSQTITVKVADQEKVGEATTAKLVTSVNGREIATENVGVGKDGGLYRYSMAGVEAKPPVLILKWPFKKGEKWEVKSKVGKVDLVVQYSESNEEVTVPASKYTDAIVVRTGKFQAGPQKASAEIWYAKGVGPVKTVMTISDNSYLMELTGFEPGKGK